jgi:hypothetical protein
MTLDCVSAVKETFGVAGRGLHVMALLQETKMLFGPLLDGLDGVSAVQEAMELHEGGRQGGSCYHHTGTFS